MKLPNQSAAALDTRRCSLVDIVIELGAIMIMFLMKPVVDILAKISASGIKENWTKLQFV